MILSNVNIGTGPSAGDGDPLRSAFTIINNNFQIIENNVNALTNSVTSVAGRTGNVILTVNDIVGLNSTYATQANITAANVGMQGYVDSKITANIALLVNSAPSTLDTIRELADAIGDDPNFAVNIALSVSTANTKMRSYVDGQITAANTASATANIGMKGYVDSQIGGTYSNINVLSYLTTNSYTTQTYVDLANTIQSAQVNAANLATIAANLGMKGYVDSVAGGNYSNVNTLAYLTTNNYATKSTVANLTNGSYTVSLDTNGNVTLPGGATIGRTASNTAIFTASTGGVLEIKSSANNNKLQVDDVMVSVMAGDSHWHFDDNGKLTLPSGANITSYGAGVTTILDDNGVVIAQQVGSNAFSVTSATGVRVLAGGQIWTFNGNGSLSFPSGQIQTTAFNNTAPIITTLIANASTQSDLIIGINANVTQANLGMKGYVDSVASQSIYGNGNVKSYLTQFDGNIVPSANVTYSLGSDTNRWKDLYLSGNTIFLGDSTISTEGGKLVTTGVAISPPTGAVGFANVQFEASTNFDQIRSYYVDNNFGYTANLKSWLSAPIVWDELRSAKLKINSDLVSGYISDFASLDTSGGKFANAVATLDATGNIASLTITDGGVGYDAYYPYYSTDSTGYDLNYIGQSYTGSPTGKSFRRIGLIPTNANNVGNITSISSFTRYSGLPTVGTNSYTWTGNTGTTISFTVDWTSNTVTAYTYTPALPALTSANDWQNWLLDYQSTNNYGWIVGSGSITGQGGSTIQAVYDYLNREALPNSLTYDQSNTTWYPGNLLVNNSATTATLSSSTFFITFNRTSINYATVENSYGNPVYWSRGLSADSGISSGGDMTVAGDLRVAGDLYVSPTSIYMGDLRISAADGNLKVNTGIKFSDNSVQSTAWLGSAAEIDVTDTNGLTTVYYPTFVENRTTGQTARADVNLTYRTDDNILGVGNIAIGASGNITFPDNTVQTTAYTGGGSYGNAEVATYLPTYSGNISAGNVSVAGTSGKIGFSSGGFAQQTTSNATQVTSHFTSGNIQLMSIDLGASAAHTVPFSCNKLTTNDILVVKHVSGGLTSVYVDAYVQTDGLAIIWMRDITGNGTGAFTPMLKYAIIRAPSS